jgi:hypothetical protein
VLQPELHEHLVRLIEMTSHMTTTHMTISHVSSSETLLDLRATEKGYRDAFFAQLEIHLCSSLSCSSSCCE